MAYIRGTVRDEGGAVVACAYVHAEKLSPATGVREKCKVTGSLGTYVLLVAAGQWRMIAWHPGHQVQAVTLTIATGADVRQDFTLPEEIPSPPPPVPPPEPPPPPPPIGSGTNSGRILEIDAVTPIPDATITLGPWTGTSDATGFFRSDPVPAGIYDRVVQKTGYLTDHRTITIVAGQDVVQNEHLERLAPAPPPPEPTPEPPPPEPVPEPVPPPPPAPPPVGAVAWSTLGAGPTTDVNVPDGTTVDLDVAVAEARTVTLEGTLRARRSTRVRAGGNIVVGTPGTAPHH